jgi:hypothetical protein
VQAFKLPLSNLPRDVIPFDSWNVQLPENPKMTNFPVDLFFSSMAIPVALGFVGALWALWAWIGPKKP